MTLSASHMNQRTKYAPGVPINIKVKKDLVYSMYKLKKFYGSS